MMQGSWGSSNSTTSAQTNSTRPQILFGRHDLALLQGYIMQLFGEFNSDSPLEGQTGRQENGLAFPTAEIDKSVVTEVDSQRG